MQQLERTERYLKRMQRLYSGVPASWEERNNYEDDVYTFFIHCHHIQDWFVELNLLGATREDVNELINGIQALRICADICNATKHYKITRKLRSPDQPHIVSRKHVGHSEGPMGDAQPILMSTFTILSDGKKYDVLEVAEACINAWHAFIEWLKSGRPSE